MNERTNERTNEVITVDYVVTEIYKSAGKWKRFAQLGGKCKDFGKIAFNRGIIILATRRACSSYIILNSIYSIVSLLQISVILDGAISMVSVTIPAKHAQTGLQH